MGTRLAFVRFIYDRGTNNPTSFTIPAKGNKLVTFVIDSYYVNYNNADYYPMSVIIGLSIDKRITIGSYYNSGSTSDNTRTFSVRLQNYTDSSVTLESFEMDVLLYRRAPYSPTDLSNKVSYTASVSN